MRILLVPLLLVTLLAGAYAEGEDAEASAPVEASPSAEEAPPAEEALATEAMQEGVAPPQKPKYGPHNPRQVRIQARVLEVTHRDQIDWGFSVFYTALNEDQSAILRSADMTFPGLSGLNRGLTLFLDEMGAGGGEGEFEAVIQALEQYGEVRVVSEPNVVVMNADDLADDAEKQAASQAQVFVKSEIPYESNRVAGNSLVQVTQFKDAAKQLTVGVEKIRDEYVQVRLNTSITDLAGYVTVALNDNGDPMSVPSTSTRSMDSTVLVRDGQTFIGGVLRTETRFEREQGVPWIARIPVLGYFFKNQQRKKSVQELLFLVRPEIVTD